MTKLVVNHVVNLIGISGCNCPVMLMAVESKAAPHLSEAVTLFAGVSEGRIKPGPIKS